MPIIFVILYSDIGQCFWPAQKRSLKNLRLDSLYGYGMDFWFLKTIYLGRLATLPYIWKTISQKWYMLYDIIVFFGYFHKLFLTIYVWVVVSPSKFNRLCVYLMHIFWNVNILDVTESCGTFWYDDIPDVTAGYGRLSHLP